MRSNNKLLKFKLFSRFAYFRTRFSFKGIDTYPLPTPSTVIGLLYNACGRKWNGEVFGISIQGYFENSMEDFRWHRVVEFDGKRSKEKDEKDKYVLHLPLLINLEVLIHIKSLNTDTLEYFLDGLVKPKNFLRLGEFPTIVLEAKYVECDSREVEFLLLPYDAWVPEDINKSFTRGSKGIYFKLPTFWFDVSKPRDFIYRGYYYHTKGSLFHGGSLLYDEEGMPVWV